MITGSSTVIYKISRCDWQVVDGVNCFTAGWSYYWHGCGILATFHCRPIARGGGGRKSDRSDEDSQPSVAQTIIDISDEVPTQSSKKVCKQKTDNSCFITSLLRQSKRTPVSRHKVRKRVLCSHLHWCLIIVHSVEILRRD